MKLQEQLSTDELECRFPETVSRDDMPLRIQEWKLMSYCVYENDAVTEVFIHLIPGWDRAWYNLGSSGWTRESLSARNPLGWVPDGR